MSSKEHKEFLEEERHLLSTVQLAKEMFVNSISMKKRIREETRQAFINYDSRKKDAGYQEIMGYASQFSRTIKNIERIKYAVVKPYFSRIDYKDDNHTEVEKIYIGKMGLFNENDNKPVVVDWRAPISSIYYDGRLGQVEYKSLDGIETGELSLKRLYTIEDSELQDIMDVDITTTDTFLQAALGESKDNRLKDIVSTIQAEQNRIIREDIGSPLIVQGVAGSGKTTIALHRIAYLIYTYEKTFDPSEFLILAPSKLFLNYISEVLPELGADQVKQSTYAEISKEFMDLNIKILTQDEKLSYYLENKKLSEKDKSEIAKAAKFKGSLDFKDILTKYLKDIEKDFLPEKDFEFMGNMLMSYENIHNLFYNELAYLPIYKRKSEIRKVLSVKLKDFVPMFYDKTENYYDEIIFNNRISIKSAEEQAAKNVPLIDERDRILKEIKALRKTVLNNYMKHFPNISTIDYYINFITDIDTLNKYSENPELSETLVNQTVKYISRKTIDYDDLSAVLYLHYGLYGFFGKNEYKYVVIDEAQDSSLFSLWILREMFNTNRFTLVGDLTQGIYLSAGYESWDDVRFNVFAKKKATYLTLEQSYRTTVEIMNFANEIIKLLNNPYITLAKPVVRHGNLPKIYRGKTIEEAELKLSETLKGLKEKNYRSVAIITKTGGSAKKLYSKIKDNGLNIKMLTAEDDLSSGGLSILPAYMAKGLEFDAVVIAEMFDDFSLGELDLKLLYVSATRALHELYIISTEGLFGILDGVCGEVLEKGI